ncbi:MAG: DUF3857 domain-containing protein [Verrucomicrobiota bacterium]
MMTVLVFSFFVVVPGAAFGEEGLRVSRNPPPIYEEKLRSLLTPLEDVQKWENRYADDEQGVILLNEWVAYVGDDDRRYTVYHYVYRANSEAGIEAVAEEVFTYRKSSQRIHLVLARTIQEDGSIDEVRPNASLLQSPQVDAEDAIYSDTGELLLIFPKVQAGSIVEMIVLKEEFDPRVPGEYMAGISWSTIWPRLKKRVLIDVPESLADSLNFVRIGGGCPEPERAEVSGGRVQFLLESANTPRVPYERRRAPTMQVGPATRVTSWEDWSEFGEWYAELLVGSNKLNGDLKARVDEWTEACESDKETIEELHKRVADDVRYTGLEFGISGHKPYNCNEVWKRGYGDCKDKANLLRAMLKHKGISSHLCLLDTEHLGRIERRSPDIGQFNHAILAIRSPGEPGGWLYSDPTISGSVPGLISPNDANREVLILRGKRPVWARTPAQEAGELVYDFDLKVEETGEQSGWLELRATGYYGARYTSSFSKKDDVGTRREMQDIVDDFYERAEVVDAEVAGGEGDAFEVRAYFVVPGIGEESASLKFPSASPMVPYLGETRDRETPVFLWRDRIEVTMELEMLGARTLGRLPKPYAVESDSISAEGQWERRDGKVVASLAVDCLSDRITPADFAAAFNAISSIQAWADQPVAIVNGGSKGVDPEATGAVAIELPIMPSAEGQMNLIDTRFPTNGDLERRRAALQKLIQYFPDDKGARFNALVQMAYADFLQDKNEEAAEELGRHIRRFGSFASAEDRGYAKYIRGLALRDAEDNGAAIEEFREVMSEGAIGDYRRAWAAFQLASLIKEEHPIEALDIVKEFRLKETESVPDFHVLMAQIMEMDEGVDGMGEYLLAMREEEHPALEEIVYALIGEAKSALSDGREGYARRLSEVIGESGLRDLGGSVGSVGTAMAELEDLFLLDGISRKIQRQVRQLLKAERPAFSTEIALNDELETLEDWKAAVDEMIERDQNDQALRHCFELLTRFEPDEDFLYYLWQAASYLEWKERSTISPELEAPVFESLMEICELIPDTNDYYYECQFTRGRYFRNREEFENEAAVYADMLKKDAYPEDFTISGYSRLGYALELLGRPGEALEQYREIEEKAEEFSSAAAALIRAIYINLELGDREEALRLLSLLGEIPENVRENAAGDLQLSELLILKKTGELQKFWAKQRNWQDAWKRLGEELGIAEEAVKISVLEDGDWTDQLFGHVNADREDEFLRGYAKWAQGARWEANSVNQLARLTLYGAIPLFPEKATELRDFVITLYEHFIPGDDDNAKLGAILETAALIDNGRVDQAVAVCDDFRERYSEIEDDSGQTMLRLWAVGLRLANKDTEEAREVIEDLLESDRYVQDRLQTTIVLADLYRSEGEVEKEEALLEREIEHPEIKSNETALAQLGQRHAGLASTGKASSDLSEAIGEWITERDLAWFEFATPVSLERYSSRALEQLLDDPYSKFDTVGAIKFRLLIARDSDFSLDQKWEAFRLAVQEIASLRGDYEMYHRICRSVYENESFPESRRLGVLWSDVIASIILDHKDVLADHLGSSLLDYGNENLEAALPGVRAFMDCDMADKASMLECYEELVSGEVTPTHLLIIRQIFGRLLSYGEEEIAERIQEEAGDWQYAASVGESPTTIRLELLKELKGLRSSAAMSLAIEEMVRGELLGDEEAERPSLMGRFLISELPSYLSTDDKLSMYLFEVSEGRFRNWDARVWMRFCRFIEGTDEKTVALKLGILRHCLAGTEDDFVRSGIAIIAAGVFDLDDESVRARVLEELEAYRDLPDGGLTGESIELFETIARVRTGNDVDFEALEAGSKHPFAPGIFLEMKLKRYAVSENRPLLKQTIEVASPDRLEEASKLELVLHALEVLDMEDEHEIYSQMAAKERDRAIAISWATHDQDSVLRALKLSETLGDAKGLPDGWYDEMQAVNQDERTRLFAKIQHAGIHEEWDKVREAAERAIGKYPTYYWFYWNLGNALCELDRPDEARPHLETYVEYARDTLYYPKARDLLEKIAEKEKPQPKSDNRD